MASKDEQRKGKGGTKLVLAKRPPPAVDRAELFGLLVGLVGLVLSGIATIHFFGEAASLAERLRREPTAAELEQGRRFGPAESAPAEGPSLVCAITAYRNTRGDRDVVWERPLFDEGQLGLRTGEGLAISPDAEIDLVGFPSERAARGDPALASIVGREAAFEHLEKRCVGPGEVYVDGCLDASGALGGCGGGPLTLSRGTSPEPIVERAARWAPATFGAALACWSLLLLIVSAIGSSAGRSGHALSERAGPGFGERINGNLGIWPLILLAAPIPGLVLSLASAPLWLAVALWAIGLVALPPYARRLLERLAVPVRARRFMKRLPTSTLATIARDSGNVELAVRIPDDAETIEVPFLEGRYACVQVQREPWGNEHEWTRPERLVVEDATGRAELNLASFRVGGFRFVRRFDWTGKDTPEVLGRVDRSMGTDLAGQSSNVLWSCRALVPGDSLYVVGDATAVQRAVGAYRGGGSTELGASGETMALATIGTEEALSAMLRRDALVQLVAVLLCLASIGLVALSCVWFARLAGLL